MKCPKCQTENSDHRKFCRECGAKLLRLCQSCSAENLPGDKFCGECGHNLILPSEPLPEELSFDEKLEKAGGMFQEVGMEYWLTKSKELIGRLESK
jgi:hypothetical protein